MSIMRTLAFYSIYLNLVWVFFKSCVLYLFLKSNASLYSLQSLLYRPSSCSQSQPSLLTPSALMAEPGVGQAGAKRLGEEASGAAGTFPLSWLAQQPSQQTYRDTTSPHAAPLLADAVAVFPRYPPLHGWPGRHSCDTAVRCRRFLWLGLIYPYSAKERVTEWRACAVLQMRSALPAERAWARHLY